MYNNKIYILNARIDPESAFFQNCRWYLLCDGVFSQWTPWKPGVIGSIKCKNIPEYTYTRHTIHNTHHPSSFNTLLNIISHTLLEYVFMYVYSVCRITMIINHAFVIFSIYILLLNPLFVICNVVRGFAVTRIQKKKYLVPLFFRLTQKTIV